MGNLLRVHVVPTKKMPIIVNTKGGRIIQLRRCR